MNWISLFNRQLRKLNLSPQRPPTAEADWDKFLSLISKTYEEYETRITMLEHVLDVSNKEMNRLYDEQKRNSDRQLKEAVEAMNSAFILLDPEKRIVICNSKFKSNYKAFDEECKPGTPFSEFIDNLIARGAHINTGLQANDWRREKLENLLSGETQFEIIIDEKLHLVSSKQTANGGIVVLQVEISERKKMEDQLRLQQEMLAVERQISFQAAKMSSLGEMAAGIAHEINNPLAVIGGKASILDAANQKGKVTPELISSTTEVIIRTVKDVAKIVTSLRTFSRDASKDESEVFKVWNIIDDTTSFCAERFRNHDVNLFLPDKSKLEKLEIRCVGIQIQQVLLNLLNNAFDAIEDLGDKWIKLEVLDFPEKIEFRVIDSGHGIPDEVANRLFQPFFTTKQVGKGTGIGLSLAFSIIKNHKGKISLDRSSPNTCFVIVLPK